MKQTNRKAGAGMIEKFLRERGAIGAEKAIKTKVIMKALQLKRRAVTERVARERAAGALICAITTEGGGYFMPATEEEIVKQWKALERGIPFRAMALRPFRAHVKQMKKAAGEEAKKEEQGASHEEA